MTKNEHNYKRHFHKKQIGNSNRDYGFLFNGKWIDWAFGINLVYWVGGTEKRNMVVEL